MQNVILSKTLESQVNAETFKFLMILVKKDNQCIKAVIATYLELVYETASIKMIEVSTAFTLICKKYINSKLKN
jgi:F0F1-type ATP synthase delta subunit